MRRSILFVFLLVACQPGRKDNWNTGVDTPSLKRSLSAAREGGLFTLKEWPSDTWWDMFASEELSRCIVTALEKNPTLKAAEKRIQVLRNIAEQKKSKLYPHISFFTEDDWIRISKNGLYRAFNPNLNLDGNVIDFSLSFDYEFDFWKKNRNNFLAAFGKERAAAADAMQTKIVITTSVAAAYFALKTNQVKEVLFQELLEIYQTWKAITCVMSGSGLVSLIPVTNAKEKTEEVKKQLLATQEAIELNRHALAVLTGESPDEKKEWNAILCPASSVFILPEEIDINLMARRPDLVAVFWQIEAYAHEIHAAKALYLPSINLKGIAGFESLSWKTIFDFTSATASLIPFIQLPVYTAGEIAGIVGEKAALFHEAICRYNETLLKAFQEITDAIAVAETVALQKKAET